MIKTNLSTRPFYNEGAVRLWLAILTVVLVLATVFNITRLLSYSRSDTEQATQAARDEGQAGDLRAEAAKLRASVDARQVEAAFGQAREANDLIDRRTFSWTELFNEFEATLPADVRITSVRPHIDKDRGFVLAITLVARGVTDIEQFIENLAASGQFSEILSREEHPNDAGQLQVSLEAVYHPKTGAPVPQAAESEPRPR